VKRTLLLALATGLVLAGCTRSADPLEWKIRADDPGELQNWLGKNLLAMPLDLAAEAVVCINNIRADTSQGPTGKQRDYRLCQRINGRTIREALIEGHELADRMLQARIANESDAVVSLLSSADQLGPEDLKKREALMNAHLAAKGKWEQELTRGERRIASLRQHPAQP